MIPIYNLGMFKKVDKKKKMGVFIAAQLGMAALLIFFISYIFLSFYRTAKADALSIGEKSVYEVGEKLNNFFLKGFDVLEVTSEAVEFMMKTGKSNGEIDAYLSSTTKNCRKDAHGAFLNVYGWINGEFIDGGKIMPTSGYVPKSREWYISAVRANGLPSIIFPYVNPLTGKLVITISKMLSDYSSVISTDVSIYDFQSFISDLSMEGEGYGFIIDKNSLVVAHTDESLLGKNVLKSEKFSMDMRNLVGRVILSGQQSLDLDDRRYYEVSMDGQKCMAFSMNVLHDWYVVMVIDSSSLFKRIKFNIVFNMIGLLFTICLIVYYCTQSFLVNLKLESKVEAQVAQMSKMQNTIIEELATLIESRDANTGEHVKNTRVYSLLIAKNMYVKKINEGEVDKTFIRYLRYAAPLHDVGKITVPDSILCKPGRLSDFEYEVMKNHTRIGGAIIRNIFKDSIDKDAVQMAVDVAQYHHERWDGKGYPIGMRGEEIPLSARILAVADCFDALVSQRCYKKSVPAAVAFEMIKAESGTHFDPAVVEVFMNVKSDVLAHLKKIKNEAALAEFCEVPPEVMRGALGEVISTQNLT